MKINKTRELAKKLGSLWDNISEAEKDRLEYYGPRGGVNAAYCKGWCCLGDQTITKACHMANIPTKSYWSGSNPTPSTSIPKILYQEMLKKNLI